MKTSKQLRLNRIARIRAKIAGSSKRPRLSVFRSSRAMEVQVIDDSRSETLLRVRLPGRTVAVGTLIGSQVGKALNEKKLSAVVFDRRGYKYHGAVRAVAEALREKGITV